MSSGCWDRRSSGRTQVARRLAIPTVYRDLDELLADRRVGVVHVASPNGHHFEQARRVLESGRHVVCEKPLATSARETAVLRALAESRPAQAAAVNYNVRYYPICHEIRERIASGALGRVLSVTGSYVQDWLLYPEDFNWRVERDGGTNLRAVADIGTHWMDLAQFLIGSPIQAVFADLATFHPRRLEANWDRRTLLAGRARPPVARAYTRSRSRPKITPRSSKFDGGERGAFHVSQVTAGRKNRLTIEIAATGGAVFWDSESPNRLWLGSRSAPNQVLERDPALLGPSAAAISHYPGGHAEGFPDTFKQLFLDVYGWIVAGREAGGSRLIPDLCRRPPRSLPLRGDRRERRRPNGGRHVAADPSAPRVEPDAASLTNREKTVHETWLCFGDLAGVHTGAGAELRPSRRASRVSS